MASIDEVIARSQKPGEFTERREFTVARGQAIKKLRQFALKDRYYCVLELIQSAVANGATYIDIQCERNHLGLSYIGGSFEQTSLAQLFDFLFAAQDNVEHESLRQLALGVNALMDFEPDQIIIETGDGTLVGTTRIIIGDDDTVQVGTPEESLDGTYLRATGMGWGAQRVKKAITERCLVAPVPILYNQDPLFGYSRQRTPPSLFGFHKTVSFDEGDLYGTIGVASRHSGAVFRMLTHGVWIESARRKFQTRRGEDIDMLGGVVTFDRLRKTADHSAIVRDGRFEEMWLRLQPYVNQLVSGETDNQSYDVRTLAGDHLDNQELLELLRSSDTVVLVPPKAIDEEEHGRSARAMGQSLGVPVLCVARQSLEPLQVLGGREVDFILCNLEDEREIEFYTQKEAELPPRPWLTSPTDLGTMSLEEMAAAMRCPGTAVFPLGMMGPSYEGGSYDGLRNAAWILRAPLLDKPQATYDELVTWKEEYLDPMGESVRARIYSPQQRADRARAFNVEVRTARRTVWRGHDEAIAPGQVLIVDVSDLSPKQLWATPRGAEESVARLIAEAVVRGHLGEVETAADRGLRAALRADVQPGSNAAQLVLASIVQRVVKRIRSDDGQRRITFSVVDPELDADVLDVPILKTLSGDDVDLRGLEALMAKCQGLLYAVRVDVEPYLEGLARERILVVDQILEDLLISLVGPTAYVRVDDREVLAGFDGVVCRDMGVGLREYPEFPLLVEAEDPSRWPQERKKQCVAALVDQLVEIVEGDGEHPDEQELRRHAWRHLQWFSFHREAFDFAEEAGARVDELPLYGLIQGRTCGFGVVRSVLARQQYVEMVDGWAVGAGELSYREALGAQITSPEVLQPFVMAMNPFVLHLLGPAVRGAAEYHLSEKEMEVLEEPELREEVLLESMVLERDRFQGMVGIPLEPVERPMVLVFDADEQRAMLREDIGERFGVVGKVRLRSGGDAEEVDAALANAATDLLSHLLIELPEMSASGDEERFQRALSALLEFADRQVQIIAHDDLSVEAEVQDRLARRILNAPLLTGAQGLVVSPMSVYREFENRAGRALALGEELDFRPRSLAEDQNAVVRRWIDERFRLQRVHGPACYTEKMNRQQGDDGADAEPSLEKTLEYWINVMHPGGGEGAESHFTVRLDPESFAGDRAGEFCQLVATHGGAERGELLVNPAHRLSRWVVREGEHSQRPIAWALLAAYGHINDMLENVTDYHEMICQRRVADALEQQRLKMR